MSLKDYFESTAGTGILSTANDRGQVNAAIYSRPHFLDDEVAFIMRDRLSHKNLESNPSAVYLFTEQSPEYQGKRLYMTKVREKKNSPLIESLKRRKRDTDPSEDQFLVYFKIDRERPLIGG
ncbi:pyridoxamine 5'-phosphate oxidase family protein [Desulfobacter hydrogenophilus]|uniref:Pyridoxamine 5'-phosphate oxidase family protein n=1 Tax=Desulfobacter hydrogenophilus TaxID=2291 RepID=A0A328F7P7_9BACT|nr:pyridoxamine 5'-phosphate oxidase family protein [Desulfobacter hydrogenophilus]NDY73294.1 pyridoxamine 5'-phosphate oxidase family protein [Desulfobacter hydrogenophilus]QBH15277.1 pyridoxamine 5'-phosphate oxidase family protein [Desulfobacter hydrogenophilus]RAM00621.1 pyridoxamine 5'-phosphate oxidase family protein [Desulfobacter hydrogenophilus]